MSWWSRTRVANLQELEEELQRARHAADQAESALRIARSETPSYRIQGRRLRRYNQTNHFAELFRRKGLGGT